MASFTNYATLSYSGGTVNSNTVTGEILDTITASKTAVFDQYGTNDDITFVISLVSTDTAGIEGLAVSDDLGGYDFDGGTVYPLRYKDGSVQYYVNGVLQPAPAVTTGPPLLISGIRVPAGGNTALIYEAEVTAYAPPTPGAVITNTASVTGARITTPFSASETITPETGAALRLAKSVSPAAVSPNGLLTYTFVVENTGNTEAAPVDNAVITDLFDPILTGVSVTFNGTP